MKMLVRDNSNSIVRKLSFLLDRLQINNNLGSSRILQEIRDKRVNSSYMLDVNYICITSWCGRLRNYESSDSNTNMNCDAWNVD